MPAVTSQLKCLASPLRAHSTASRSATKRVPGVAPRAQQGGKDRPLWAPGAQPPSYLDGSLPGDFGFDPLKLGEQPQNLMRYREAEVIHCRWAMLGVVGCLGVEGLGYGKWVDAALWPWTGEQPTYFGKPLPYGLGVVVVVEFVLMGFVERKRAEQSDPLMRLYPGKSFDPLKLAGSGETMEKRKLQEIKNGRLAMLAMLGFFGQAIATQKGPLANLSDHIADPWHVNAATNPKAVPFLK